MKRTLLAIVLSAWPAWAAEKKPVIIDTDIGSYVDDAWALGLAIASPELDIKAITTVGSRAEDRAWIACRFLSHSGTPPITVAYGRDPQPTSEIDGQIQYRRHPAPLFNRTHKPTKGSPVAVMYEILAEQKAKTTIIALGPLTNIAALLAEHPDAVKMIDRIVLMGGSIAIGYDGKKKAEAEWNIKSDIPAAQAVFKSGVPLTVVPLDATATVRLANDHRDRLFAAHTPLTFQMQALYELWDQDPLIMFDTAAVAALVEPVFFTWQDMVLTVDPDGMTKRRKGESNARVATAVNEDALVKWFVQRIRNHGQEALPTPPKNVSNFVERGSFPARVHVVEDFNTDIEKRWWLAGKVEAKDVPKDGGRACRAVVTQDFDDLQGQLKTSYRAVIFNPVPGPPLGANTRLRFRYKLTGTDTLRVQLYSLTKGYHRYLSLTNVPRNEWREGVVDLTQMRRPDGTGGPLSADERIDDIQFYIDPRATLLIDDILLYEAATAAEQRPFPKQVFFTGWFDTGKQGKEWPGSFTILPHTKPRTWNFAQSLVEASDEAPTLRVGLRGERVVAPLTELTFAYQAPEGKGFTVELHGKGGVIGKQEVAVTKTDWQTATVTFDFRKAKLPPTVESLVFRVPKEATLRVDDVLLYEPANP
jgi:inosine-uridine nucleoside N-ribohydrolase